MTRPRSSLPELARIAPDEAKTAALEVIDAICRQHPEWIWPLVWTEAAATFDLKPVEFGQILFGRLGAPAPHDSNVMPKTP